MASPRFETVCWGEDLLKISLLGEWLFWIKVGYLSPPRRIISLIIDATLRKDSENVSSALVSGYFWDDSPYWTFSWKHRRKDLPWREKDDLCLSFAPLYGRMNCYGKAQGCHTYSSSFVEYGRHVINFGKLWIIAKRDDSSFYFKAELKWDSRLGAPSFTMKVMDDVYGWLIEEVGRQSA